MIDFHSHVLPGIDDGSSCEEESLDMLRIAKESRSYYNVSNSSFLCSK